MNLSQFSVNNRIFGNMITIAVFAAGLFVAFTITRELFPKTEMDIVVISTIYRNASPDEVENHITIPLEEEVRSVDGVDDFISTSSEGISSIVITLDPDEDLNKERVINDISRKVDRLRLPDDVEKPDIMIISGGDEVIHITVSGNVSEERIRDVASDIKARIEAIPGVSKVDKVGWRDPETWIEVDPNKLIENELSLEQVAAKVAAQNINMPGGKMQSHDKDTILRTVGEFANLDDVRRVVVRSNSDGQLLTIDDIATVRSTYSDDATTFRANGSRAIKLDVRKKLGGDTLTISDAVTDLVHVIRKEIADVDIGIMDFESFVMRRRLKVLVGNGLMGLILVLCALPLVLNFRMALVTALGIPFAFMGTLIVMSAVGMTINIAPMTTVAVRALNRWFCIARLPQVRDRDLEMEGDRAPLLVLQVQRAEILDSNVEPQRKRHRDAQNQHAAAVYGLLLRIEGCGRSTDDVFGHGGVDLTGQFDKPSVVIEFTGLPGQVEWVDGNTVSTEARTRVERHVSKWLGLGRVDHLPDINIHRIVDQLQFIDQSDVNAPEDILEKLGRFSGPAGGNWHQSVECFAVEFDGPFETGRGVAPDNFWDRLDHALWIAGILAFRREG